MNISTGFTSLAFSLFYFFIFIILLNHTNDIVVKSEIFSNKTNRVFVEYLEAFSNTSFPKLLKNQNFETQHSNSNLYRAEHHPIFKFQLHPRFLPQPEQINLSYHSYQNYNYYPRTVHTSLLHSLRDEVKSNFTFPPTYILNSIYDSYKMSPRSYSPLSRGGALFAYSYPYQGNYVFLRYLSSFVNGGYAKSVRPYNTLPQFREQDIIAAFDFAKESLKKYQNMETQNFKTGYFLNATVVSTSSRHLVHHMLKKYSSNYFNEKNGRLMEYATQYLAQNYFLSPLEISLILPYVKLPKTVQAELKCKSSDLKAKSLQCKDSKYRSIDGKCNNLYYFNWGMSFTCQQRLLPPAYQDGISSPRSFSVTGLPLPPARIISTYAHPDVIDFSFYTIFKMLWGQFVNHDLISTPASQAEHEGGIKCCPEAKHPQCYPIKLPPDDYQTVNYNRSCINVVRSAPCPLCTLGPRQQMNADTAFLDASPVYGSSLEITQRLRLNQSGLLKMGLNKKGASILPTTNHPMFDQCLAEKKEMLCFDAGDERVNQHPGLMIIHLLMARNHNMHAYRLHTVNPHWDDERLFQEARRIVIAEIQHITYSEYLPILFGPILTEFYKFKHHEYEGFSKYEPFTNPSIFNEYGVAAGRFGHSSIQSYSKFESGNQDSILYKNQSGYFLRDMYFDPTLIHENYMDYMIKGYLNGHSSEVDPYLSQDIKNYLYRVKQKNFGNDLSALNVQRGREHGTPPYYVFAEFCFGFQFKSWYDLSKFIPQEKVKVLQSLYKHWKDIDLFTGGLYERKAPDADFGPTFTCIVGIQFYHTKYGDRYFYTHGNETGSFTQAQLRNIFSTVSLASILCKFSEDLESIQPYAFFLPSSSNVPRPCYYYRELNYTLWKENSYVSKTRL